MLSAISAPRVFDGAEFALHRLTFGVLAHRDLERQSLGDGECEDADIIVPEYGMLLTTRDAPRTSAANVTRRLAGVGDAARGVEHGHPRATA